MAELHTLRSTLQAHGVPHRVDSEHALNMLGPLHSAATNSRIMVPVPALNAARELAESIVGPFECRPTAPDEPTTESPFRREAEYVDSEHEVGLEIPRPKSYAVLALVGMMGGSWFGLGHLYTGRPVHAGVLSVVSLFAIGASLRGAPWAPLLLGGVWWFDMIRGAGGIATHNEHVEALLAAEDSADEESEARGD